MRLVLLTILFLSILFAYGAEPGTDSLEQRLVHAKGKERITILNDMASACLDDAPAKSIDFASEALKLSRESMHREGEAKALFCLAEASVNMNNLQESIPYYLQSAEIEKQLHGEESQGYADRLGDIGYSYYMLEQFEKALIYLGNSLEISLRTGYDSQAASMYSNIGSIYTEWGNYSKALDNQLHALDIDRRLTDSAVISTDLNNIGKILEQWGKFHEGIQYYSRSLQIAQRLDNKAMIAIRYNNLGICYKFLGRYDSALAFFQKALEIEKETGNLPKVGRRLMNIAATYLEMGDRQKCYAYLNQAMPILCKSALVDDMARLNNVFGRYHQACGHYREAISSYLQSQDLAHVNDLKPIQIGNLKGLSESYQAMGKNDSALSLYRDYVTIKDSVFTSESSERLAKYQAQFENEKMQLENTMLRKDAEFKRDVYLFSTIGAILLLTILGAVIVILRLKARNSQQARAIAEQEAKSLRMELELKNKELTCNAMSIIEKNEAVSEIIEGLEKAIGEGQPLDQVKSVFERIRVGDQDTSWNEFELRFTQVHKEFYDKLNERYPDLTPNERKLCAFLRLNMTTKDIASITHQSVHSINVARTRLRKKINLANSDENLIAFLINL